MNVATMSTVVATVRDLVAPRSRDLASFFILLPSQTPNVYVVHVDVSTLYACIVIGAI